MKKLVSVAQHFERSEFKTLDEIFSGLDVNKIAVKALGKL